MKCRVCGDDRLNQFLDLGPMPLANALLTEEQTHRAEKKYPLALAVCVNCTFVQLTKVVPPEEMYTDYPYATGTSQAMTEHFAGMASDVDLRITLKPPARDKHLVVDIGSNDGTLLKGFKALGWRTLGIEPAANLAAIARKHGIDTVTSYLNPDTVKGVVSQYGNADAVTATNVFSHVDDVYGFLRCVKALLSGRGAFVVEVYNLLSLLDNGALDQVYHEHLSYFTPRTLAILFEKAGLQLWHVEKVPVHGGSLRAYASLPGARAVRTSVSSLLETEPPASILFDRIDAFVEHVDKVRKDFRAFIVEAFQDRKRVIGYTAPAKATILLNACGTRGGHGIEYLVDDNPLKQGKYVPGVHIPILGPEAMKDRPPDYVIIFAWNLVDEIVRKLVHLKKKHGTQFFVPLPEFQEVG